MEEIPDPAAVRRILDCFEHQRLVGAIGGSGLLAGLGLTGVVHDWDLTTDGAPASVEVALVEAGYPYRRGPTGVRGYATTALYIVDAGTHEIDVIVGFAVWSGGRRIALPTRVAGTWRGLPLADPTVWEQAYRVLGQRSKADLLALWQERSGSVPGSDPAAR